MGSPTANSAPAAVVASAPAGKARETAGEKPGCWLRGLVFSAFTSAEALPLAQRIRKCLGPLKGRGVSPEQLLKKAPADDELLILPLRQEAAKVFSWVQKLRRHGVTSPVLFVLAGGFTAPEDPVAGLGAVDYLSLDEASDFALWRSLRLLEDAHQREREIAALSRKLAAARDDLDRRREEMGYLTYSLAAREIDDELTGERAEERAMADVNKRIRRSRRYGTPLTCLLIGIDDMEEIKQLCGASFAAFVMVQVAFRLKRTLRHTDLLWRYGEDTFLLLTSGTSDEALTSLARRLIDVVATGPLEDEDHTVSPSIGIGAARYRPEMTSSAELLDVAKLALGSARHQGKGGLAIV